MTDVEPSADDNKLVRGVSGDDNGTGYFGYAYYATNTKSLRVDPDQEECRGAPAVEPNPATRSSTGRIRCRDRSYLYVKKSAHCGRRKSKAFVKYLRRERRDRWRLGRRLCRPDRSQDDRGEQEAPQRLDPLERVTTESRPENGDRFPARIALSDPRAWNRAVSQSPFSSTVGDSAVNRRRRNQAPRTDP